MLALSIGFLGITSTRSLLAALVRAVPRFHGSPDRLSPRPASGDNRYPYNEGHACGRIAYSNDKFASKKSRRHRACNVSYPD